MYTFLFHPQVKKQIKRLHPQDQKRLGKTLSQLAKNPFSRSLDVKKLIETKESFRLRVGDFRILYSLNTQRKIIYFWEVGYRGGIY